MQSIICPNQNCAKKLKFRLPVNPGIYKLQCKHCGSLIQVDIKSTVSHNSDKPSLVEIEEKEKKSSATQIVNASSMNQMVLVQKRRILADHVHKLRIGDTLLGRESTTHPSDIQFSDEFMSTQSVKITTIYDDRGFSYKLMVMRATNPVYYNGQILSEGETIFIKSNDAIIIGKTKFFFKKV